MGLISVSRRIADVTVRESLGEEFVPIVKHLKRRRELSESELSERFDGDVNYTRSLLYRLHSCSFVGFARKKDEKIGWYVYYWFLKYDQIYRSFFEMNQEKIAGLQRRLERERKTMYFDCPDGCMRLDFDKGTEYCFKCPECGCLMDPVETSKHVREIKKQISGIKAELKKTI
ncbi:MAG: hypothetical protein ACMXYM_04500 [Candidatus Woesearchaeota archaeon]